MATVTDEERQASYMADAVNAALVERVKLALKTPLMRIAEEEIDKAVNDAISDMNIDISSYKDAQFQRQFVDVVIRRGEIGGNPSSAKTVSPNINQE